MPRACCKTTEHHGDVACFSRSSPLLCCRLNGGVLRDNPEVTSLIRPINAPSKTIGTEGVPDKAHTLDDRRRGGVDSRDHGEPMQKSTTYEGEVIPHGSFNRWSKSFHSVHVHYNELGIPKAFNFLYVDCNDFGIQIGQKPYRYVSAFNLVHVDCNDFEIQTSLKPSI